jgi:hypothetical protein
MNMVKQISIYSIICDRGSYSDLESAKNWILANGLKADNFVEDEMVLIFHQRDKSNFKTNTFGEGQDFRMVVIENGVLAVVGELNEEDKSIAQIDFKKQFLFSKVDMAKRIVTGPVLMPDHIDLQGDFEFIEDIEKTAHKFMMEARNIGEMHRKFGGIADPVESWILRDDWRVQNSAGFKVYPKGTWMMTVKISNEDVWKRVVNGELTGFSIGFHGTREAVS